MKTTVQRRADDSARAAFTLVELLVVLLILVAAAAWGLARLRDRHLEQECRRRLWHLYTALEMYEIDRGSLPRLAFFPKAPERDPDSLLTALRPYTGSDELGLCPAAPPEQRALGLTFVWNVENNGRALRSPGPARWMLVELSALSEAVPAPHHGGYHILYTDGQVQWSASPPPDLRRL